MIIINLKKLDKKFYKELKKEKVLEKIRPCYAIIMLNTYFVEYDSDLLNIRRNNYLLKMIYNNRRDTAEWLWYKFLNYNSIKNYVIEGVLLEGVLFQSKRVAFDIAVSLKELYPQKFNKYDLAILEIN